MIIGVSGFIASGKTTVCELIAKHGFKFISLSDILREECRKKGIEPKRENLRKMGDKLRKKHGKGALARIALEKIKKEGGNWVIGSVRLKEEAELIKKAGGILIFVYAPLEVRYRRAVERGRRKYESLEDFRKEDEQDRTLGIDEVMKIADFIIVNDSSLEELEKNVEELLRFISSPSRSS